MTDIGQGSTGDPQDIAAILTILRRAGEAVGKESDGVVAMFDPAPTTVLFDYLAAGVTTLDELRTNAQNLADHATDVIFEYPKVTVHVLSADVAYSLAYSRVEATLDDGSRMRTNSRVTDIWQKSDGVWRAVHEHGSVPVDVASGKADLLSPI